jgi:hypothetical protein
LPIGPEQTFRSGHSIYQTSIHLKFALSGCAVDRVRRRPQAACRFERLKAVSRPPFAFFPGAVQFAMMRPAERDRKFIADLLSEPARLRKAKMVRVAGLTAANEAGLLRHKA